MFVLVTLYGEWSDTLKSVQHILFTISGEERHQINSQTIRLSLGDIQRYYLNLKDKRSYKIIEIVNISKIIYCASSSKNQHKHVQGIPLT